MVIFLCFERSWKNLYFHSKMASPPATYDVISRNHRKWPSNLSQNVSKRVQVIHEQLLKTSGVDALSSRKIFRKTSAPPPPSPLYTRRLLKFHYENHENHNKTSKWNKTMIGWERSAVQFSRNTSANYKLFLIGWKNERNHREPIRLELFL